MNGYDAGTATGKLDLDVSGLNKGVSDAKKSLEGLDQTATTATGGINNYAQALNQNLAKAYEAVAVAVQQQEKSVQRVIDLQNALAEAQSRASSSQTTANTSWGATAIKAMVDYQKAIEDIARIEQELTVAQQEEQRAVAATTAARKQYEETATKALQETAKMQEAEIKATQDAQAKIEETKIKESEKTARKQLELQTANATKIAEAEIKATQSAQAKVEKAKIDAAQRAASQEQAVQEKARASVEAAEIAAQARIEKAKIDAAQRAAQATADAQTANATKVAQAEITAQAQIEQTKIREAEKTARAVADAQTVNATKVAQTEITATQNTQAKIEKAKIDAAQRAATQEQAIQQKAQTDIEKARIAAEARIEQTKIKEAEKAARAVTEAERKERERANREAEKEAEKSAKAISDAQVAAYSVINRAVNDTIDLVKKLAQEMFNLGEHIVEVGASFEQSMAQVAATSGMSASEVANNISAYADLVESARTAGETTMFTATQAGEALNYLALAGYSVEESIATMPSILTIAAAGAMDLGRASDMVTDAMNALGIEIDRTDEFIDKMARTAQTSNTNVEQLGNAILTVGGTATILKDGVTELDTALGLMANSGIKARQGGTALRQILLNLTAPAKKGADMIEKLGLEVYDAEGNMRGLQDIFADLNDIMKDFTDQERMQAMRGIFDARYIRAANTLMEQSGEEWTELAQKIDDADGAAEKMADTMMSTFKGAIITAKSTLESIEITINEGLRKNLTDLVNEAIPKLREFNDVLGSAEVQAKLEMFSAKLKEIALNLLDKILAAAPKIADWLATIDTHIENLVIALGTIVALKIGFEIEKITTAISALNVAFATTPWMAVIAIVSTAVIVFKELSAAAAAAAEATLQVIIEEKDTYAQLRNEVNATVEDYRKYKEAANENAEKTEAQVGMVKALYDEYKRLHDAGEDTTFAMQALADEIPEVNALLADGKTSFEDITGAVNDYTDAIIRNAKVEAAKEGYKESLTAVSKLEVQYGKMEKAAADSRQALDDWDARYAELKEKADVGYLTDFENMTDEELAEWDEMQRQEINGHREALVQINNQNQQALQDAKAALDEAQQDVQTFEDNLTQIVIKGNQDRTPDPEDTTSYIGIGSKHYQKALAEQRKHIDDFLAEVDDMDRQIQLRKKTEADKFDLVREWFKANPDWNILDEDLVKLYDKLATFDEKASEDYQKQLEKTAKEREDAAKKAQKAAEDRDKEWVNNTKSAWADIQWDLNFSDATNKQLADAGRQFLADNKAFYDTHLEQKEDFIKDIAALDKKWIEDSKTTIEDIEAELPKLKEFYGEDSPIYKSMLNVLDTRKLDDSKKAAEKWFEGWTDGYEKMVKEAQDAYSQLQKDRENFEKNYIGGIEFLTEKTKKVWDPSSFGFKEETVEVFDPKKYDDALKQLKELETTMNNLKAKGLSEDLLSQIWEMDPEEALKTAKELDKANSSTLKQYSDSYDKYKTEVKAKSDEIYGQQIQDFQDNYITPLQKYVTEGAAKIQEDMDLIGKDTVQGYIDGMAEKYKDVNDAVDKIGIDALDTLRKQLGIESPSKEFYKIGEFSIQGFLDGLGSKIESVAIMFKTIGERAGDAFVNAFKTTWDNFVTLLNTGLQVPVSMTTTAFGTPTAQGSQVIFGGASNTTAYLTKSDVVSAIQEAMPSGDVILQVDGNTFARVSRDSLNNLALQEGSMGLNV